VTNDCSIFFSSKIMIPFKAEEVLMLRGNPSNEFEELHPYKAGTINHIPTSIKIL
jgi:hypothetical protein